MKTPINGGSLASGPMFPVVSSPAETGTRKIWLQWAVLAVVGAALFGGLALCAPQPAPAAAPSTIGGTEVPDGLACAEDEIIGFTGIDQIGCVHVEGNVIEPASCASSVFKAPGAAPSAPERSPPYC